ncbi:MAG: 2-oxo acid dehydrogenase subunit E2 [Chloroflexi bacterium]|nr:2-oxo acid dehydrogenase subunit E2 [Chloroflexota bacterium]
MLKIYVEAGETVPVGTVLGFIGEPGEAESEQEPAVAEPVAAAPVAAAPEVGELSRTIEAKAMPIPTPSSTPKGTNGTQLASRRYTGRISPVVGRIAAENDIDLDLVPGTGKDGRITKQDVMAYLDRREKEGRETAVTPLASPPPPPPIAKPASQSPLPAGEILPLTSMRRGIADHMVRSKHTSPHVTTIFEFDFTAVTQHRAAHKAQFARDGAHLTFTAYIVAATVAALKSIPSSTAPGQKLASVCCAISTWVWPRRWTKA